ncbi:MAG: hypothetical protein RR640_01690, partial [Oscillospiraceae bacterium]
MAIEKMNIISITGKFEDLDNSILKCCENENFHPESPSNILDKNSKFVVSDQENPYSQISKKLCDFCTDNEIDTNATLGNDYFLNLESLNIFLDEIYKKTDLINSKILDAKEQKAQYENTLKQINHIIGLNYSFEDIFSCRFVTVRFGRMPNEGFEKLAFYKDKPFYFSYFDKDDDYHWGVYFVPHSQKDEIDYLFKSLYFERIYVPDYAHGTPD